MKLSIVTPTYNSVHTLQETLDSVANQDHREVEHIVMDGGSTDGTVDLIRRASKIRWVSEKDEGHYHAMNKGIEAATGEAVGILNSDDCYCPGVLAKISAAFEAHPEWDALFGDIIFVDGEGNEIFRREEAGWDPQIIRFGMGSMVNHMTLFLRKRTYERLGLYRHQDFKNSCDYELLVRLADRDCRVGHIREYIVRFRYHQYGQSADRRIVENTWREVHRIQDEYDVPGGLLRKILYQYARLKRQIEKLLILGKCDLIPGKLYLQRHLRSRAKFSSNIGLDKL